MSGNSNGELPISGKISQSKLVNLFRIFCRFSVTGNVFHLSLMLSKIQKNDTVTIHPVYNRVLSSRPSLQLLIGSPRYV